MTDLLQEQCIDPGHGLAIVGRLPASADAAAWKAAVEALGATQQRFVAAGGLGKVPDETAHAGLGFRLAWAPDRFAFTWERHALGAMDLVVLLRMLLCARPQGQGLDAIEILGQRRAPEPRAGLPPLDALLGKPVQFRRWPNVELEFNPMGSWVEVECRFDPPVDPEVRDEVDGLVRLWSEVVNAGAFQTGPADSEPPEHFGAVVGGPTEGDDFLGWSIQTLDVPLESVVALVNLLDAFNARTGKLRLLYVG